MRKRIARLPPALTALALQVIAYGGGLLAVHYLGLPLTFLQLSFISGSLAAMLGYFAGLAIWWLPIQLIFIPALQLAVSFNVPPWIYLAAFLTLLVVYWSTFKTQVPLYLSSEKVWEALETLLPDASTEQRFEFMDLGCGMGGVLAHLARLRPDGHFHGVESAPLPFIVSWLRIKLNRQENCKIHWGSLWATNLDKYDVVYAYLSPVPMEELWRKVCREMRPGTLFVSNTFGILSQTPERKVQVNDLHRSTLYIWRV